MEEVTKNSVNLFSDCSGLKGEEDIEIVPNT